MTSHDIAYDIIPDIHGDLDRLESTLIALGYGRRDGVWRAPAGRRAAFLGDLIDTGAENLAVIHAVRAMRDAGEAVAIMGNHELNALLYHMPGENAKGDETGYMRSHRAANTRQHASFLAEAPVGSRAAREALDFFATLPLFLDLGGLRLAHASWSESRIAIIRARRPDGLLAPDDLQPVALESASDAFVQAVLDIVKGPETELPDGYAFHDHNGTARKTVRVRWWAEGSRTWREIAASVPDPGELPVGDIDMSAIPSIDPGALPVAFGHYKRRGSFSIDAPKALCLDYPAQPLAYRWDGEPTFSEEKVVFA